MDLMGYLESAKKSLFRWEALQEYRVHGEDKGMDAWWTFIHEKTQSGILMERVRLILFPCNEYTRKEILTHKISVSRGDDIRYVDKGDLSQEYPKDFWLIDDATVLKMNYGEHGEYEGLEIGGDAEKYISFKDTVLKLSKGISELQVS